MSLCLDARLTNTIESVRCVVVMRFQVNLREYTSGYSAVTNDWSTNRYFVIAWDGDSSRYDRHPVEGGRAVWDTGVPIMELLTQFWQGMDFDNWRAQFPEPKLAPEQDDQTDSQTVSVTASSARSTELTIDSILPYFIIKRKWNARIEND